MTCEVCLFLFCNIGTTEQRRFGATIRCRILLSVCSIHKHLQKNLLRKFRVQNSNGTNPIAPEAIGDRRHRKPTKILILRIYASRTNCRSNLFLQSNLRMRSGNNDFRRTTFCLDNGPYASFSTKNTFLYVNLLV